MMVPKVSQEELGAALGVTFQQVQKYEKGKKPYERGGPRMIDAFLKLKTDKLRSAVADLAQALARAG
jgi:transcriptional regulator with XRE-family HTH domain